MMSAHLSHAQCSHSLLMLLLSTSPSITAHALMMPSDSVMAIALQMSLVARGAGVSSSCSPTPTTQKQTAIARPTATEATTTGLKSCTRALSFSMAAFSSAMAADHRCISWLRRSWIACSERPLRRSWASCASRLFICRAKASIFCCLACCRALLYCRSISSTCWSSSSASGSRRLKKTGTVETQKSATPAKAVATRVSV
mmetsp:Transcript_39851/g.78052  ORF Transcript_39851/g.78052 Transcript_39851/m.78052 type:complete len:200 (+) Transcript_39851:314-913(+)